MSIQVISNTPVAAPAAEKAVEETKPVLAAEAAEQKSEEQGSTETEAKEENESEESAEADESESDESENEEGERPKKKSGAQRRREIRERAERAEAELARLHRVMEDMALKGAGEPKPEKAEAPKAEAQGKPNPDDFDTHAEYVEALTDWKTEQKFKERESKAEKAKLQTEQERLIQAHSERVKSFADKTEDFQDVIEAVDDVRVSPTIQELIVTSENGPELMYELAKNRAEFERICKLGPLAAAREIGRIESKLQASEAKKPEATKITKAPKPPTPVSGGASGSGYRSLEDVAARGSQAEYEAFRRKQMKQANA